MDREAPRPGAGLGLCLAGGAGAGCLLPAPEDEASFFPSFFSFLSLIWPLFTGLFPKQ